jgi:hypothetical protein
MLKVLFGTLAIILTSSVAQADVVFVEDGSTRGGGQGRTVCVSRTDGRVDCLSGSTVPDHRRTNAVVQTASIGDSGRWLYHNDPSDPQFGQIQIDCLHMDTKGRPWATY